MEKQQQLSTEDSLEIRLKPAAKTETACLAKQSF